MKERINLTIAKYDWLVFWFFVSFNCVGLFMFLSRFLTEVVIYLMENLSHSKTDQKFVNFDNLQQMKIFLIEHYVMSTCILFSGFFMCFALTKKGFPEL